MDEFDPQLGLIKVVATLGGPEGEVKLNLALDTGATTTLIGSDALKTIGCDLDHPPETALITTASGRQRVPLVDVPQLRALGRRRETFRVIAEDLPLTATVDGLLGLDFLRGCRLTLNFIRGTIRLDGR